MNHYTNDPDCSIEGRLHEAEQLAAINHYLSTLPDEPTNTPPPPPSREARRLSALAFVHFCALPTVSGQRGWPTADQARQAYIAEFGEDPSL